jgi:hypothetical protein
MFPSLVRTVEDSTASRASRAAWGALRGSLGASAVPDEAPHAGPGDTGSAGTVVDVVDVVVLVGTGVNTGTVVGPGGAGTPGTGRMGPPHDAATSAAATAAVTRNLFVWTMPRR